MPSGFEVGVVGVVEKARDNAGKGDERSAGAMRDSDSPDRRAEEATILKRRAEDIVMEHTRWTEMIGMSACKWQSILAIEE
jgi:hypothetical protein